MSGSLAGALQWQIDPSGIGDMQTRLRDWLALVDSLGSQASDVQLGSVNGVLSSLLGELDIDVVGFAARLSQSIATIRSALPLDTLQYIEGLGASYQGLKDFLQTNALVQQLTQDADVQQAALDMVDAIMVTVAARVASLGDSLIDAETLGRVRDVLQQLETIAAGDQPFLGEEDLVEFLSRQVLGVEADLLGAANRYLDQAMALLDPLGAVGLQATLNEALQAASGSFELLAEAMVEFDVEDAQDYPALETLLKAWSDAVDGAFTTLEAAYGTLTERVGDAAWDNLFPAYAAVLSAVPLARAPTVDDAIDEMVATLESLRVRLNMILSSGDLVAQVGRVSVSIHEMFAQSALPQVQQILIAFVDRVQAAADEIPAQQVQDVVRAALNRVRDELDALDIHTLRQRLELAFGTACDFVDQEVSQTVHAVEAELFEATQSANISVEGLAGELEGLIDEAGDLVAGVLGEAGDALDQLKALLERLDNVDFRPVADEVVDEIDALKTRLQAIRPDSLSDVERTALRLGFAALRAIDLETRVVGELKLQFAAIDHELSQAVETFLDAWLRFREKVGSLDAAELLGPVQELLDEMGTAVNSTNGSLVLQPLKARLLELTERVEALSPGAVLDPLLVPYQAMMEFVARADPAVWIQPLVEAHAEIEALIARIDITPMLLALESKQRALFNDVRGQLFASLEALSLPAPLDDFLATMKSLAGGFTDAVFGDPDGQLQDFNLLLASTTKPSALLHPLNQAFDRLVAAIDALPPDEVLVAMETLRRGLGAALPAMNPAHLLQLLRDTQGRLEVLSPTAVLGAVELPGLCVQLDARLGLAVGHDEARISLQLQLELALACIDIDTADARLQSLDAAHQTLMTALRQRINGLDSRAAQAAFVQLDTELTRLLPAFLRQPQPLTMADIQAGLARIRPSTKAVRIDDAVDRLLAEIAPLQAPLNIAVTGFFQQIRQAAQWLHPGVLSGPLGAAYATLHAKLDMLKPENFASDLQAVWAPVASGLEAMAPTYIKSSLDASYGRLSGTMMAALTALMHDLRAAIDSLLQTLRVQVGDVRTALDEMLGELAEGVQALTDELDDLLVDELLERLLSLLDKLEQSFNLQLDRVRNEFDDMLAAMPLSAPAQAEATA